MSSPTSEGNLLVYDDPNDIIHDKLPLPFRKEAFKRRMTSKVTPNLHDILPRTDILPGNSPSIDQMAKLTEQEEAVTQVLKKRPSERQKADLTILANFFDASVAIPALKKEYGPEVLEQVLRQATLCSYKEDEDIVKFEQLCPFYYLIISGVVKIMQPVVRIKAFVSVTEYKNYKRENLGSIVSERAPTKEASLAASKDALFPEPLLLKDNSHKVEFTMLEEVALLRGKDGFGEFSTVAKKPGQISFKAKTKVILARLGRQEYLPIVKSALKLKAKKFVDGITNLPFFKLFSQRSVEKLAAAVNIFKYAKKQNVYKENDSVSNMYIVKEGEFEVVKIVNEKPVKIRHMTVDEVFGDEEIIMGADKRTTTVQCVSLVGTLLGIKENVVKSAIAYDEIQAIMEARAAEQAEKVAEKIGVSLKFAPVGKSEKGLKRFGRRKVVPLSKEEYRNIKRKLCKLKDERIIRNIKKSMPNYKIDLSCKYYDSKVARGEEDEPFLCNMLNTAKVGRTNSLMSPTTSLKTLYPFSRESSLAQYSSELNVNHGRNYFLSSRKNSTFRPCKPVSSEGQVAENLLAARREFFQKIRRRTPQRGFVTTLNIRSNSPSRHGFRRSPQENVAPVSEILSEIATEFVGQYKAMANGIENLEDKGLPEVVHNIFQSNQYVQNMIKSAAFIQRRSSQRISPSKHNLFRFRQLL